MSRASVESVELSVCSGCARYGKLLAPPNYATDSANVSSHRYSENRRSSSHLSAINPKKLTKQEKEWKMVDGFSKIIRAAREKSNLSQQDFAVFLQEKVSLVGKWEAGTVKPNLETARKLEKLLGVTLLELDEIIGLTTASSKKSGELTVGDLINNIKIR